MTCPIAGLQETPRIAFPICVPSACSSCNEACLSAKSYSGQRNGVAIRTSTQSCKRESPEVLLRFVHLSTEDRPHSPDIPPTGRRARLDVISRLPAYVRVEFRRRPQGKLMDTASVADTEPTQLPRASHPWRTAPRTGGCGSRVVSWPQGSRVRLARPTRVPWQDQFPAALSVLRLW